MKHPLFALLALGLLCGASLSLPGCAPGTPASTNSLGGAPGSVNKGSINGIGYEIHGGSGQNIEITNGSIKIKSGANVIEIKEGRISLNGKDRGPIKSGDSFVLDAEGQLSARLMPILVRSGSGCERGEE
jgi:hypothetical protein